MRVKRGKRSVDLEILDMVHGKFQGRSRQVENFHTSG